MNDMIYLLHVLSALHVGGEDSSDGYIDQPIAREAANDLPQVPGSTVKGVLRDEYRLLEGDALEDIFGPESKPLGTTRTNSWQGALTIGDAYLLALPVPVQGAKKTFLWLTCPFVLERYKRDCKMLSLGDCPDTPVPDEQRALLVGCSELSNATLSLGPLKGSRLQTHCDGQVAEWAQSLAAMLYSQESPHVAGMFSWQEFFTNNFALVSDYVFSYLCRIALVLRPRISISPTTGVATNLWYIEALPPETLLWGMLNLTDTRRSGSCRTVDEMTEDLKLLSSKQRIQFGGSATVGFGQCRWLVPYSLITPSDPIAECSEKNPEGAPKS